MKARLVTIVASTLLAATAALASDVFAASSQSVTVDAAVTNSTSAPTLATPINGANTGTTPTLSATYTDPEGDTGTLSFEVCSDTGCTLPVQNGTSASGLASGTNGSWTVGTALPAGTYYWRARSTDQYLGVSAWTATRSINTLSTPDITSINPATVTQGASGVTIQLNGSGFMSGATAGISGSGVTVDSVSFVSSSRLDLVVSTTAGAATGTRDVTVVNPDTGATTEFGALAVTSNVPVNTVAPAVSGTTTHGQVVSATTGSWTGSPTYTYQWQRCTPGCVDIVGATSSAYTLVAADIDATVRSNVTATNGSGSSTAASAETAAIAGTPPSNTTAPSFTGPGFVGERFTASPGSWSSPGSTTYDYQWRRCDTAGSNCVNVGTNSNIYYLIPDDAGSTLRVAVTATNSCMAGCGSTTAMSVASAIVMNHFLGSAGSASQKSAGNTLVVPVSTSFSVDEFAVLPISFDTATTVSNVRDSQGNQWKLDRRVSNGALLSSETWSAFMTRPLSAGDTVTVTTSASTTVRIASLLRFQHVLWPAHETASSGQGTGTSPTVGPHWTAVPTVTVSSIGTDGGAGDSYSPSTGTYAVPTVGTTGAGANMALHSAYLATNGVGSSTITGTLAAGRAWAETAVAFRIRYGGSTPTSTTTAPAVSGVTTTGQTLTATDGTWTGFPSFTRFWSRCDGAGTMCQPIPGATGLTYVLTSADVDRTLRYTVVATTSNGSTSAVTGATAVVAGVAPANTTVPTITGAAEVGSTLTASTGSWSGSNPLTYAYQWQRCTPGCASISGATSSSYTTTMADAAATLRAVVTASNTCTSGCGSNAVNTAETSSVVVNDTDLPISAPTIAEGSGPQHQHVVPGATPRVWINTDFPGSFTVRANASDPTTGVQRVEFPGAATFDWTPVNMVSDGTSPFEQEYGWGPGSTELGLMNFVVYDSSPAFNSATGSFDVQADSTDPTGGSLTVPDTITNASSASISFAVGTDADSGIGSHRLHRATGTYSGGACTTYGSFNPVGVVDQASAFVDTGLANGRCYRYELRVMDNVGNVQEVTSVDELRVDHTPPTGSFDAAPTGPVSASTNITGSITDAGSLPANVAVAFSGPQSGTVCNAPALTGTGATRNWSCSWNTAGLPDGTYTLTLSGYDVAGNAIATTLTRTITLDGAAPAISSLQFTEQAGAPWQHAVSCTLPCTPRLYVNPVRSGSVDVTVDGTDAGSGIATAGFPDLDGAATRWSPGSALLPGPTGPWTRTYSFTGPGLSSVATTVTLTDGAGNASVNAFNVLVDAAAPTGSAVANPPAYRSVTSVPVGTALGTDGTGSGVASMVVEREQGTLAVDACTLGGTWTQVALVAGVDTTVATARCYRYRVVTTDNVGNVATSTATSVVRVDTDAPSGTIAAVPADPWRGNVAVTGTSADVETAVAGVALEATGAGGTSPVCPTIGAAAWSTPGCAMDTTTMADGSYVLRAAITDRAGNVGTATRSVVVDNGAPTIAHVSTTEVAGAEYQHTALGTTWVSRTGAGTVRVAMSATDAGTGVASVQFPAFGGGWSPAGGSVAAPGPYEFEYDFGPSVSGFGAHAVTAIDQAGNGATTDVAVAIDDTAPAGGVISYPATGSAAPTISFAAGTDTGSGVRGWLVERRDAPTTSSTSCDTGSWSSWAMVGVPSQAAPMTDTAVAPATCYQYRLTTIDNVANAAVSASATTYITPTPRVVVSPSGGDGTVAEGGAGASWTVVLTSAPVVPTRVELSADPRLALSSSSVTFDALTWNTPQSVTATAASDGVDTTPDAVGSQLEHRVASGDPAYVALASGRVPVTIVDTDVAGIVVGTTALAVSEPATTDTFEVRLATRPLGSVTVSVAASSGQASASPGTLTFDATSWDVAQRVAVGAIDDPDVDGPASVSIGVRATSTTDAPYAGLSHAGVGVTVADDDVAATVVDATGLGRVSERTPETATTLSVRLAARPASDVRVAPTVPGGELRAPTGTLTFTRENWNTSQAIRLLALDDAVAEPTPHAGRVVLRTSSADPAFDAIADDARMVEVADDDPARLVQRPGTGWSVGADDVLELGETGERTSATVAIAADGDPTRSIRIEPVVSSAADVRVTPASATIDPAAPNEARSFTVSVVDDGVAEAATEPVRLTWKVTTVDPMYEGKGVASTSLSIADAAATPDPSPTGTPNDPTATPDPTAADPQPSPDPAGPSPDPTTNPPTGTSPDPGTPSPDGDGGGDTPPGTTVGDDDATTTATGPEPNRSSPSSHRDTAIKRFAKDHPVVTSGLATGALAAGAAIAKPLLIGGKIIGSMTPGAGGGMGQMHGLGQLRRLIRRKGKGGPFSRMLRFLRRRRRRPRGEGVDPLDAMTGPEYDDWRRMGREWRDLLDPKRNGR